MKNYVQRGDSYDFTAPAGGVIGGTPVKIGDLVVIPSATVAQGLRFAGNITGVYDPVPAATGQAWTEGQKLYWDDTAKVFTSTAASNTKCANACEVKASADAVGRVRLHPCL